VTQDTRRRRVLTRLVPPMEEGTSEQFERELTEQKPPVVLVPDDDAETAIGVYWIALPIRYPVTSRIKRLIDIAGSLLLITLSSPLIVLVMAFIWIVSRGPAIYVQRRIGYRCREFDMYKFRTMVLDADRHEHKLKQPDEAFLKVRNDPRITWWGRFLRRFSIDELPQLFNVLEGSMSLVGPRPLLLSDLGNFPLRNQMRRFSVHPGLTGLWQVSGRSSTSEEERLELDKQYVNDWSLWLDVKILARTVFVVLSGRGAV
jgi:lipopolysaccharide/colanic/teichoic acid biosynthesis glycosyltransferase